jgi:hypothetical protein
MTLHMTRISTKFVDVEVWATLRNGNPTSIPGVDVAALPKGQAPDADTEWLPADYTAPVATFLVSGPDASSNGALRIEDGGSDLWVRVTDQPEVDATRVDTVNVY